MARKKQNKPDSTKPVTDSNETTKAAFNEAEKDISRDPDLSVHSPNDDLDEAETARLGEDRTDLV